MWHAVALPQHLDYVPIVEPAVPEGDGVNLNSTKVVDTRVDMHSATKSSNVNLVMQPRRHEQSLSGDDQFRTKLCSGYFALWQYLTKTDHASIPSRKTRTKELE